MINPAYDPVPDAVRAEWTARGRVRLHDFLQADVAQRVLAGIHEVPHTIIPPTGMQFQMALHENFADEECDHTLCEFTRWWFGDGMAWISDLIGQPLKQPDSLVSSLLTKGGYLDPHNDKVRTRQAAYVLGFTEASWPWQEGGNLEFLRFTDGDLEVTERLTPGFNTLDLFDVQRDDMMHRVSMITEHHERRTIIGWFHKPDATQ